MPSHQSNEYRVYTKKFDLNVNYTSLDNVLGPLSAKHSKLIEEAWEHLQLGLLAWKTDMHLLAGDVDRRIRGACSPTQLSDTAVTLLFDQSGSMRGQKMLHAAATADVVQEFLLTLGITCEVLGFTTSAWKGGRSRKRWRWRFKPKNPGRLNDILHIVYKPASDKRCSTGNRAFREMLRPDLPKENIDGEAILWACSRLEALPQGNKILILLSDGAPVDDSTIAANSQDYLYDHLEEVVEQIVADGRVSIAALGICRDIDAFYPITANIDAPGDMARSLMGLIEQMVAPERVSLQQ